MILIVDDKQENLLSLRSILQLNQIEVDTASSGEEALQKVLKTSYALIILDVQMPGMDGFEVAEAITGYSKTKDIPIIFLSAANTHKKFITKGYESGAIDYVTKPVDTDILLFKIKTFQRLYEQKNELSRIQNALREEIAIRQKAQETLNDNVRELHSIIEAIPQIAFTAKPDGTIEFVNEHWYRYSADIKEFPEVPDGNATIGSVWQNAVTEGRSVEMEVCIRMLETAEYRYHLLRALPVRDGQNNISKWVGTLTDIQEQKQINQLLEQKVEERTLELQQSNEELEAKNHELQQFTSVASHDLKEPLRKIQVFSSIVKEKLEVSDYANLEEYLRRIIVSGERMSGLINDLLAYSRLSMLSLFEDTNLNKIVHNILLDLEIPIVEKDAKVDVDDLPVIQAIPGQIRQLFQNIISNALKFSRPGVPPVIEIRCSIIDEKRIDAPEAENGAFCRLVISDNGIGFDEQYLEKIFTLFQRLNSKEAYEGTGIGLAIAKKIVEKHNGLITARSKENEGATFIIVLPLKQEKELQPAEMALQLDNTPNE
jgi:signal transduction histidine kinase/FixJ family two-component response regulator